MTRDEDFIQRFRAAYSKASKVEISDFDNFLLTVINGGADEFYIGYHQARRLIKLVKQGRVNQLNYQMRRRALDLFRVYISLRMSRPSLSKRKCIEEAIVSPAPSFYISVISAKKHILNKNRYGRKTKNT